jgi:hypothetical protein
VPVQGKANITQQKRQVNMPAKASGMRLDNVLYINHNRAMMPGRSVVA